MKWIVILAFILGGFMLVKLQKVVNPPEQAPVQKVQPKPLENYATRAEENILTTSLPDKVSHGSQMGLTRETLHTLYELTYDPSEKVRWTAVELLYRTDDPNITKILLTVIGRDPDPGVKVRILDMVSADKDKQSLKIIAAAVKDFNKEVRLAALRNLKKFNYPEAIPVISRALNDEEQDVKLAAMDTLKTVNASLEQRKKDEQSKLAKQDAERLEAEAAAAAAAKAKNKGEATTPVKKGGAINGTASTEGL